MKQILSFNITVSSVMWEIFLHLIFLVMRDYKMYPKSNTSYFKCVYLLPFLWSALDTFNAGPPSVLTEITSERCKEYTFSDQLQRNPRPQTPLPPLLYLQTLSKSWSIPLSVRSGLQGTVQSKASGTDEIPLLLAVSCISSQKSRMSPDPSCRKNDNSIKVTKPFQLAW